MAKRKEPAKINRIWVTEFRYRESRWLMRPQSFGKTKAESRRLFDSYGTPDTYHRIRTVKFVRAGS